MTAPTFRADVNKYVRLLSMVSRRITKSITAVDGGRT